MVRFTCSGVLLLALMAGVSATPVPKPAFSAEIEGPVVCRGKADGQYLLKTSHSQAQERRVSACVTIRDYFCRKLAPDENLTIVVPPGKAVRSVIPLPASVPSGARVWVALKWQDGEADALGQEIIADSTNGPRRELVLDDVKWSITKDVPVAEALARLPGGKQTWPGAEAKIMLYRHGFDAPAWLSGGRYELFFSDIRFGVVLFVNGQYIATRIASSMPMRFDISGCFKPGASNLVEAYILNKDALRTPPSAASEERWTNKFLWPVPSAVYGGFGIYSGMVRLRAMPAVSADSVFVIPEVREKSLSARVELVNHTPQASRFLLEQEVYEGDRVILTLAPRELTLKPGETRTETMRQAWPKPVFWAPDAPRLCRLRTTLKTTGGAVIDQVDSRFGYRELWISGNDFIFNGKKLRTYYGSSYYWPNHYGGNYRRFARALRLRKDSNIPGPYLTRAHLEPLPEVALEAADELGVLLVPEGPLGSTVENWASPETWKNTETHMAAYFQRVKNHPSAVMWSACNEILTCINTQPDMYAEVCRRLAALGNLILRIDPTRPVEFNGDADLDGAWSTMNLHYPRSWFLHPDLPNSAFWLKAGGKDLIRDHSFPMRISWDRPKPIIIGEDALYIHSIQPHDMASFGNDEAYRRVYDGGYFGNRPIDDVAHAMMVEGYRDAGVALLSVSLGGSGGPEIEKAMLPVRHFVREKSARFHAGEKIKRTLVIHHDTLTTEKIVLDWKLKEGENVLAKDRLAFDMGPAGRKDLEIELPMPAVSRKTPVALEVSVSGPGGEYFRDTQDYAIYPVNPFKTPGDLRLGVFDMPGRTTAVLKKLQIPYLEFFTIEDFVGPSLAKINCLLVGEDGFDRARLDRWKTAIGPFLEKGGTVIVLNQPCADVFMDEWGNAAWGAPVLRPEPGRQTTLSWRRSPRHPILRDLSDQDLRWWRVNHIVSTGDYEKPAQRGWRPLIDSGGRGGLRWTSLAEFFVGKGRVIICQLAMNDNLLVEPAARALFENMLAYAVAPGPAPAAQIGRVSASDAADTILRDLGFELVEGTQAPVIVIDAAAAPAKLAERIQAPSAEKALDVLRDLMEAQGRVVMLRGLTPENLGFWQPLLPKDTTLKEVNSKRMVRKADHALLEGISGTDIWWSLLQGSHENGESAVRYAAFVPGAELILEPGALNLLKKGKGALVIEQSLWDTPPNSRKGGRYVALLLDNLSGPGAGPR